MMLSYNHCCYLYINYHCCSSIMLVVIIGLTLSTQRPNPSFHPTHKYECSNTIRMLHWPVCQNKNNKMVSKELTPIQPPKNCFLRFLYGPISPPLFPNLIRSFLVLCIFVVMFIVKQYKIMSFNGHSLPPLLPQENIHINVIDHHHHHHHHLPHMVWYYHRTIWICFIPVWRLVNWRINQGTLCISHPTTGDYSSNLLTRPSSDIFLILWHISRPLLILCAFLTRLQVQVFTPLPILWHAHSLT